MATAVQRDEGERETGEEHTEQTDVGETLGARPRARVPDRALLPGPVADVMRHVLP